MELRTVLHFPAMASHSTIQDRIKNRDLSWHFMCGLEAAIDETLDGKYLAFVVGEPKKIGENAFMLPQPFTHMTRMRLTRDEKKAIIQSFNFEGEILVYCIKFGLPKLQDAIREAISTKRCRRPKNIILSKAAYEFVYKVRFLYADFVRRSGMTVDDLIFQVDNPLIQGYLKDGGLRTEKPGFAHRIADCIAYANSHSWPVNQRVLELGDSFERDFHSRVIKALTR